MSNRRRFIENCSALTITTALGAGGLVAASVADRPASGELPGLDALRRAVGSEFRVRGSGGPEQSLVLAELAEPAGGARGGAELRDTGAERFSLIFRGATTAPLGQDTYIFRHRRLGWFHLFVVPVDLPGGPTCCYEAVIHRPANGGIGAIQAPFATRRDVH